jgi:hypothetical protein
MSQESNLPISLGERVRVHKPKASESLQGRLYKVVKSNPGLDWLQLEWIDAPKDSKERFLWVLKDFVRKA